MPDGIPAVHSWYTFEDLVSPGDRVWIVIENTGLLLGVISTVRSGYFCMRVDEASREIVNGYQHAVISTWKTRVTNIHVWGFMIKEEVK